MYTPYKISFYAYALSEDNAEALQNALNRFVREQYNAGALVTTEKIMDALELLNNSPLAKNFLK